MVSALGIVIKSWLGEYTSYLDTWTLRVLKQIEYGVYEVYIKVFEKIIFYLLQGGCGLITLFLR